MLKNPRSTKVGKGPDSQEPDLRAEAQQKRTGPRKERKGWGKEEGGETGTGGEGHKKAG